jgi:hypothetical protein
MCMHATTRKTKPITRNRQVEQELNYKEERVVWVLRGLIGRSRSTAKCSSTQALLGQYRILHLRNLLSMMAASIEVRVKTTFGFLV